MSDLHLRTHPSFSFDHPDTRKHFVCFVAEMLGAGQAQQFEPQLRDGLDLDWRVDAADTWAVVFDAQDWRQVRIFHLAEDGVALPALCKWLAYRWRMQVVSPGVEQPVADWPEAILKLNRSMSFRVKETRTRFLQLIADVLSAGSSSRAFEPYRLNSDDLQWVADAGNDWFVIFNRHDWTQVRIVHRYTATAALAEWLAYRWQMTVPAHDLALQAK